MSTKATEPVLMMNPDLYNKIMRELEKPENQKRIAEKMKNLKHE